MHVTNTIVESDERVRRLIDRRQALTKLAAGMAVTGTALIVSVDVAAAASCCTATGAKVLIATCQPDTAESDTGCQTVFSNTTTVCRTSTTQTMRLAMNSAGTRQPYFDEVAVITVTSPTSVVRIRNVIRWQSDCRDPSGTDINITGGSACASAGSQPTPALDITSAFGSQCGVFTVNIRVRNSYSPYGYSTCWIVPV